MSAEKCRPSAFRLGWAAFGLCASACIGAWVWGAILYLMAGDPASAGGAIVLPPIGILHGIGAI
jgi:hypothetical protein